MNRTALGVVLLAGVACVQIPAVAAAATRPNIIFILADDLGYGDLGCYGQEQIQTPQLDQMAAEGLRFTQCYAGSTVCAPSRCALMTGLHTGHALIRGNKRVPLRPDDVTIAEVLKTAGYTTGIIGKWGLGEPDSTGIPNRQGFDEWFGYLNQRNAHNYYPEFLWHNQAKFPLAGNAAVDGVATERAQYSHDLFTQRALQFVADHRDGPFFLYLAYTIPHANNERGKAEGNGMEVPDDKPYSRKSWPRPQKNHAAMITRMDADIGRLLQRLREFSIDEKTVVFFTSDNGPHKEGGADPAFFRSAGPLRGYKRDLYDGGIRVPMLVRWPGTIAPGSVSDLVWASWDFLPTAAELAGAKAPAGLDGISVVPALIGEPRAGRKQPTHEYLYWEFHERGFQQAVRMGDWKAVRPKTDGPLELFDLGTDIGERNDVAPAYPDVVSRIESCLDTARSESKAWPVQGASSAPAARR